MVDRRALVLALVVLLAVSGCLDRSALSPGGNEQVLLERVNALEEENADLREQLEQENLSVRSYENQLAFYRSQMGEAVCTLPGLNSTALSGSASLEAPAVMQRRVYERDGPFISERIEQEGSLIHVTVEIAPGRGRVLVHTTPLMGEVFQDAANTAVFVAQARTGRDLSRSDVIVSIVADDEVPAVNGGSAGALMTLLMISAIEGSSVRSDVTLTGTIDQEGHVGAIGGVLEKAMAAKEKGKTLFLLPRENSQLVRYTERTRDYYGYTIIQQVPERVDAKQYIESKIGIRTEYVENIEDVLRFAR
ncbi:MAG: S16 family serine protease [Methanoregulaceae archaeon]